MRAAIDEVIKPFKGLTLAGVCRLNEVIDLPQNTLLHAGPPYASISQVPVPVRTAAAQTLVLDGVCKSLEAGLDLITTEAYQLCPAQDDLVVTPLAQVVSSNSWVFKVTDGRISRYAPLVEGPPPALRFGSGDPQCLTAMRAMDIVAAALQAELARNPLPLQPVIKAGLLDGDECHAVTLATHRHFLNALPALESLLAGKPWFVLPILMAASAVALGRVGTLCAAGGNGVAFGWRSTLTLDTPARNRWLTVPASAPEGQLFSDNDASRVLPAIGDSAVIDFAGLGAQALAFSPDMQEVWRTCLPDRTPVVREHVINPQTGLVCVSQILRSDKSPSVHLAMVDAHGSGKILGRAAYTPDPGLFAVKPDACDRSAS